MSPADPDDADTDDRADDSAPEDGHDDLGQAGGESGRDGVEHLQRAAHEMIAAARSFLDVVEDVVGDSAAVASVADVLSSMGQAVARAGSRARDASGPATSSDPDDGDDGPRIQHIDVS
jgi:hypothetical protein